MNAEPAPKPLSFWILTGALALTACASAPPESPSIGDATATPTSAGTSTSSGADVGAGYEVHEWGLMDVDEKVAHVVGGPMPESESHVVIKKPILYFHLDRGTDSLKVDVTVQANDGVIAEHFPAAALDGRMHGAHWKDITLSRAHCDLAAPSKDAKEEPYCPSADHLCEADDLPRYVTADSSCIHGADFTSNMLFYRVNEAAPPIPFDVKIDEGKLVIAHARAADFAGPLVYVHRDVNGEAVNVFDAPSLGASVTAAPPTADSNGAAIADRALDAAMHGAGLSDEEVESFHRAWKGALWGDNAAAKKSPKSAPAPVDALVFVMPMSLMDGVATVTFQPKPRAFKRFLVVRLHV